MPDAEVRWSPRSGAEEGPEAGAGFSCAEMRAGYPVTGGRPGALRNNQAVISADMH